MRALLNFDL